MKLVSKAQEARNRIVQEQYDMCDRILRRGGIKTPGVVNPTWFSTRVPKSTNCYKYIFDDGIYEKVAAFSQSKELVILDIAPGIPYWWRIKFNDIQHIQCSN